MDLPDRQTAPETSETNVLVDAAHSSAESLAGLSVGIELADHNIGRVRDDGAENTGDITTSESYTGLRTLGVIGFLAWKTVVYHFDDGFERCELHHGVRDLSTPQRVDALVQPIVTD